MQPNVSKKFSRISISLCGLAALEEEIIVIPGMKEDAGWLAIFCCYQGGSSFIRGQVDHLTVH